MKKHILIIAIILLAIYFNSCAPAYVPNVVNSPMLTEKQQLQASVNGGTSGLDVQTAYSVSNHLGIIANGSYMNQTNENSDDYHKHIFGEIGPGYFKPLGKFGLIELYGGAGIGKINSNQTSGVFESSAHVMVGRAFVQPGIAFTSKFVEASLCLRSVMVYIWDKNANNTAFFFEPAISLKAGTGNIKAIAQVGLSIPFSSKQLDFNYEPFLISVGIQGRIGFKQNTELLH